MIEFKREGDVLLNIPASTGWDSPHVMIVEFEDGDSKIRLEHGSNIFMNNPFKIGFYDNNNNLQKMINSWHAKVSQDGQSATLVENGFSDDFIEGATEINGSLGKYMIPIKVLIEYIKMHNGYIRFVTTTYGNHIYDIKVALEKK